MRGAGDKAICTSTRLYLASNAGWYRTCMSEFTPQSHPARYPHAERRLGPNVALAVLLHSQKRGLTQVGNELYLPSPIGEVA